MIVIMTIFFSLALNLCDIESDIEAFVFFIQQIGCRVFDKVTKDSHSSGEYHISKRYVIVTMNIRHPDFVMFLSRGLCDVVDGYSPYRRGEIAKSCLSCYLQGYSRTCPYNWTVSHRV